MSRESEREYIKYKQQGTKSINLEHQKYEVDELLVA